MNQHIRKWGNSIAVRIPAATLAAAGLKEDDPVEVREENGRIVIEPARRYPGLASLIAAINPENLHDEIETGDAAGREAW